MGKEKWEGRNFSFRLKDMVGIKTSVFRGSTLALSTSGKMTGYLHQTKTYRPPKMGRAPSAPASPSQTPAPSLPTPPPAIHEAWTPEVRINYETGEMNSVPGLAKVYSNGYPDGQLYVYNATARNVPTRMPAFTFEEGERTIMDSEIFPDLLIRQQQHHQPPTLPPLTSSGPEMYPFGGAMHPPGIPFPSRQLWACPPRLYSPPYRLIRETQAWPRVYEVYGTAIGIILKSMCFKEPPDVPGNLRSWLLDLGLPLDRTQMILEDHYSRNPNFYEMGHHVCRRRPRELKERLRTGVEAASWPGNTDFSELRATFELLRRKALELLEQYRDFFDDEYRLQRRQHRRCSMVS